LIEPILNDYNLIEFVCLRVHSTHSIIRGAQTKKQTAKDQPRRYRENTRPVNYVSERNVLQPQELNLIHKAIDEFLRFQRIHIFTQPARRQVRK